MAGKQSKVEFMLLHGLCNSRTLQRWEVRIILNTDCFQSCESSIDSAPKLASEVGSSPRESLRATHTLLRNRVTLSHPPLLCIHPILPLSLGSLPLAKNVMHSPSKTLCALLLTY